MLLHIVAIRNIWLQHRGSGDWPRSCSLGAYVLLYGGAIPEKIKETLQYRKVFLLVTFSLDAGRSKCMVERGRTPWMASSLSLPWSPSLCASQIFVSGSLFLSLDLEVYLSNLWISVSRCRSVSRSSISPMPFNEGGGSLFIKRLHVLIQI